MRDLHTHRIATSNLKHDPSIIWIFYKMHYKIEWSFATNILILQGFSNFWEEFMIVWTSVHLFI